VQPEPELVAALNLLPGAAGGYARLGQKKKAIAALIAWVVFLIPPSCGVLSGVVAIIAAIDGYQQAQHLKHGHPIGQWTFFGKHH
jgi:hypothetical protein